MSASDGTNELGEAGRAAGYRAALKDAERARRALATETSASVDTGVLWRNAGRKECAAAIAKLKEEA